MTDLQRIEFDMFKVFAGICDKLGLTYYLVCGSALGAVKYNGFIPWDDDLDLALLRPEYEIFCREAPSLLSDNLFLQTYITDQKYPFLYAKLRNNSTTFIESGLDWLDINHGVYIDIFPIDGYPSDTKSQKQLEIKKKAYKLQCLSAVKPNRSMKRITRAFLKTERFFGCHRRTGHIINRLTAVISEYKPENSLIWCNHGNWQGRLEYAPCEQYGQGAFMDFEGIKVRIPEKYDEYLTQKYGDWRADLPKDQQVRHHHTEIIDLARPYTDYIQKSKCGDVSLKTKR